MSTSAFEFIFYKSHANKILRAIYYRFMLSRLGYVRSVKTDTTQSILTNVCRVRIPKATKPSVSPSAANLGYVISRVKHSKQKKCSP